MNFPFRFWFSDVTVLIQSWWGALWCSAWLSALPCLDLVRKNGLNKESVLLSLMLFSFFYFSSFLLLKSTAKWGKVREIIRESTSAWGNVLADQCAVCMFCSCVMCLQFTPCTVCDEFSFRIFSVMFEDAQLALYTVIPS